MPKNLRTHIFSNKMADKFAVKIDGMDKEINSLNCERIQNTCDNTFAAFLHRMLVADMTRSDPFSSPYKRILL